MSKKEKVVLQEDWVIVSLGFIIICASIFAFVLPVPTFSWKDGSDLLSKVLSFENLGKILLQFVFSLGVFLVGALLSYKPLKNIFLAFPIAYFLTILALVIAGNSQVKATNLEAVIFSLAIGLLIGNTIKLPTWFLSSLSAEFFVKIGLVILGTTVIFSDILKAGALGMIQALIVVLSVWYFAFWLCKRLKVDEELSMMIASAVSICGVSAAIATAGAIKGDAKKLSYVISLVLITAIPMMIFMPYVATYLGLSQEVTGAWLGGSIDTTGAVVASGTLVGETALKVSTIVKFSQNVLLGLAAFAISIYWTYNKKTDEKGKALKPTWGVIWERFPKFVLGFVLASLLFSFFLSQEKITMVKDSLKNIQTFWFVLAFTCIGLETKFSDIFNSESQKPLIAFLIAQFFNILITLVLAYLLFQ